MSELFEVGTERPMYAADSESLGPVATASATEASAGPGATAAAGATATKTVTGDSPCVPESETGRSLKSKNTLVKSFSYAASGVRQAATERNFKVDLCAALVALALCAGLHVPAWGWVAVVICIGAVLAAEAVNTAVEAVVDLASPDIHPLAKRAKDTAAAAALILALTSVVVAAIVFVPAACALFCA